MYHVATIGYQPPQSKYLHNIDKRIDDLRDCLTSYQIFHARMDCDRITSSCLALIDAIDSAKKNNVL